MQEGGTVLVDLDPGLQRAAEMGLADVGREIVGRLSLQADSTSATRTGARSVVVQDTPMSCAAGAPAMRSRGRHPALIEQGGGGSSQSDLAASR